MKERIKKLHWKPGTMLMPVPVVMVSCRAEGKPPNIITIAWAGTVCSNPPMLAIAVRPERYSFDIIRRSREFVVNIPSDRQLRAADKCGVVSGRTVNKFEAMGLTPGAARTVKAPIIEECPINIECRVRNIQPMGSHTLFIAEVKNVQVSASFVTADNRFAVEKAGLVAFAHGQYFALGRTLGYFGFSVKKKR